MMNGQSRQVDKERMERMSKNSGTKFEDIRDQMDAKDYRRSPAPKSKVAPAH